MKRSILRVFCGLSTSDPRDASLARGSRTLGL
jgi:hypothetical protein